MRLFDIIRASKSDVKIGDWKNGTIPHASYPLGRRGRSLGRGWSWRIATFEALDEKFAVLIALSEEKESYRAELAWFAKDGFRVVCHHELHTSHFNWHCHFHNGDLAQIEPKKSRDRNTFKRWPTFSSDSCCVSFEITKANALTKAAERYRFFKAEEPTFL